MPPTSLALQDDTALGGPLSVLVRQKRDHVRLDRLLHQVDVATGRRRDRALLSVYRLVFPHAFAEESVLWPVARRVLPDGEELTLQVEREHQEVNELVTRLDAAGADAAEREDVLARLAQVLREDVRDEEDALLPRLQERLSPARLRLLGVAWEVVRRTAPTRAHPRVARRPPGNALAALPLTVVDNTRDLCTVAALRLPRAAAPLRVVDRALARLAGLVERVPPFQVGERAATHQDAAAAGQ